MDFPFDPFWDFALDVYRRPGVGDACIALQEDNHVDVNVLLFACWVGASGRGRLSANEMDHCMATVERWHESVVRPLRGVRRILKNELADGGTGAAAPELTQALRRAIQAREIDAEHIEQLMLTAAILREPYEAAKQAERLADAASNATLYLIRLGNVVGAREQANLAIVLSAAFPVILPNDVQLSLKSQAR